MPRCLLAQGRSYTQYVVTTCGYDSAEMARSPALGLKGFTEIGVELPPVLAKTSLVLSRALLKVYATSAVRPWKTRIFSSFCTPWKVDQAPLLRVRTSVKLQSG